MTSSLRMASALDRLCAGRGKAESCRTWTEDNKSSLLSHSGDL